MFVAEIAGIGNEIEGTTMGNEFRSDFTPSILRFYVSEF